MAIVPVGEVSDTTRPVTSPLTPLARDIVDNLAPIYRDNPGWFTQTPAGQASTVIRWLFDNLFRNRPAGLPPAPTVPFTGGQCQCDLYDVRVITRFVSNNGLSSDTTYRLPGAVTAGGIEPVPNSTAVRRFITFNGGCNGAAPSKQIIGQSGLPYAFTHAITVTKVSGADNCGNQPPQDPAPRIAPTVNFNINLPDIRVQPNILIPVGIAVFRPEFSFSPQIDFNMRIDLGGINLNFDGLNFTTNETDITSVNTIANSVNNNTNTQISSAVTNINNSTTTSINSSRTAINSNTDARVSNAISVINTNTNSQTSNISSTVNNNTNTQISSSITSINNNTNNAINSAVTNINSSTNSIVVSTGNSIVANITGQLNLLAAAIGFVRADLTLALEFLARIDAKPDCPEPPLPPSSPDVDDVVKPEEPKTGNNPRIQAVTIVITQRPNKTQWGGGNGAPDKLIAGWFAWKVDGWGFTPQLPINYEQTTFIRPANVSGYAYTLTNLARGFAIEHTLRQP